MFTHRGLDTWTHRGRADHEEPTAQPVAQVRIGEKEYTPETERSGKPLSVNSWNVSLGAFAYYVPILVITINLSVCFLCFLVFIQLFQNRFRAMIIVYDNDNNV